MSTKICKKRFFILAILTVLFATSLTTLQKPKKADAAVSNVANDYNLSINTDGTINNLKDEYQIKWIHAGLMKLTFKSDPNKTELNIVPKQNGNNGTNGIFSVRNGYNYNYNKDYGEHFVIEGWPEGCFNEIHLDMPDNGEESVMYGISEYVKVDVDFAVRTQNNIGSCITSGGAESVKTTDFEFSNSYFGWVDSGQIQSMNSLIMNNGMSAGDMDAPSLVDMPSLFKQDSTDTSVFIADGEQQCSDIIIVDQVLNTMTYYLLNPEGKLSDNDGYDGRQPSSTPGVTAVNAPGCEIVVWREWEEDVGGTNNFFKIPPKSGTTTQLANPENTSKPAGTGAMTVEDPNLTLSEGDVNPSCEGADALGWIICPITAGILNLNDVIFRKFLLPFLTVDPINTNDGIVFSVWSAFRTVGNILLVFALLFIVIGQAIGGGLVDAYTAKKAMPRIFIAAILINISIYIVAFMVDMGNILGAGIGEMITAPAEASGDFAYKIDGIAALVTIVAIVAGLVIAWIIGAAVKQQYSKVRTQGRVETAKFALTAGLFFGFPILLVIVGIFATLIIRLGLILLLTILSPVALAMFAIPSAEKYAKKWLDYLIKSILVYPIVVALFALSYLLSVMVSSATGGVDFAQLLTSLIVYGGIVAVSGLVAKEAGNTPRTGTGIAVGSTISIAMLMTGAGPDLGISSTDIITSFISIIILFIPLVLIPFAFKLAGGIMGSLLGSIGKVRDRTDTLVRGDKHNPHGRFIKTGEKLGRGFTSLRDKHFKDLRLGALNSNAEKISDTFGNGLTGRAVKRLNGRRARKNALGTFGPTRADIPTTSDASPTSSGGSEAQQATRQAATQRQFNPSDLPSDEDHETLFATTATPAARPWATNTAPSSPYPPKSPVVNPVSNPVTGGAPQTQASVAQAQFGRQQAGGQNTSNDGYTTPSGLIVPDTDTVIEINNQKNK